MADKENDNQVLSYDIPRIEEFIARLSALIEGFEQPAKDVKAVGTALHDAASAHTNGGVVSPYAEPLGKAVDYAIDKTGRNLEALVESLENDRNALQKLVERVTGAEHESAHSIRGISQPETVV